MPVVGESPALRIRIEKQVGKYVVFGGPTRAKDIKPLEYNIAIMHAEMMAIDNRGHAHVAWRPASIWFDGGRYQEKRRDSTYEVLYTTPSFPSVVPTRYVEESLSRHVCAPYLRDIIAIVHNNDNDGYRDESMGFKCMETRMKGEQRRRNGRRGHGEVRNVVILTTFSTPKRSTCPQQRQKRADVQKAINADKGDDTTMKIRRWCVGQKRSLVHNQRNGLLNARFFSCFFLPFPRNFLEFSRKKRKIFHEKFWSFRFLLATHGDSRYTTAQDALSEK